MCHLKGDLDTSPIPHPDCLVHKTAADLRPDGQAGVSFVCGCCLGQIGPWEPLLLLLLLVRDQIQSRLHTSSQWGHNTDR